MTGPLHREVEAPRRAAGAWGPLMVLAGAAMITIMSAVAVLARPPRTRVIAPVPRLGADASLGVIGTPLPPSQACGQRVWRASPDGRAEQFEDCATPVRR